MMKCWMREKQKLREPGSSSAMPRWSGKELKVATTFEVCFHGGNRACAEVWRVGQWRMVLERYSRGLESKCWNSCLSGLLPVRNTAETPNSHQIPPWLLEGVHHATRSGGDWSHRSHRDLDSPLLPLRGPSAPFFQLGWWMSLWQGGYALPQTLNVNASVAIP